MSDLWFPNWLRVSSQRVDVLGNSTAGRSIYTGALVTTQRGGERMKFSIGTQNASNRETDAVRSKLASLRAQLRGQANRIWYSPAGYVQRGSFPAPELLSNNTFSNGTTGWSISAASMTVSDRIARLSRQDGTTSFPSIEQSSFSVTQYVPYVARTVTITGRGAIAKNIQVSDSTGDYSNDSSSTDGYKVASKIALSSIGYVTIFTSGSGGIAGDFFDVPWTSASRCMLTDNGTNLLTYSDQIDNAAWTKSSCTISANLSTAPDGTVTGDGITESTTGTTRPQISRTITVSSVAQDICIAGAFQANARSFVDLLISSGGGYSEAWFNLSTGAVGTIGNSVYTNPRTFIQSLGGGWYYCCLITRKTTSDTAITVGAYAAATDAGGAYSTTTGTGALVAWRLTASLSSVPVRLVQTTTTASTGTAQTGPGIYVKGLPASTNGLLLEGDYVQVGNQLCTVSASLNSDAAGLGYLQLAYPLRTATADNDPVIVNNPMGKFVLSENNGGWGESPGIFADHEFVLEEA